MMTPTDLDQLPTLCFQYSNNVAAFHVWIIYTLGVLSSMNVYLVCIVIAVIVRKSGKNPLAGSQTLCQ